MHFGFASIFLTLFLSTSALAVDFKQQVQPVLEGACVRCHGADKAKGGLRLDSKQALLKGGSHGSVLSKDPKQWEESELVRRVTLPRGHEDLMPQETEPLSGPHRKWLLEWVQTGANWPDGLVLKPHKKEIPGLAERNLIPDKEPKSLAEAAATLDTILARENATLKGTPPPMAPDIDDHAFLRRASVDLIGRIPTIEEVHAFEKLPPTARRERLVDKLIAHPGFVERWTAFFADMLRVRSQVEGGGQLLAYVNQSLREAKPYDQMVRELISTNGRPEQAPAAGFALGDAANPMPLAGATSQIFLGVRLQCAECHDHPFDDWKQKEFYELAAFFGQTKRVETGKKIKTVYTTEGDETAVKWPPEREQPPAREPVPPKFPFELISFKVKPHYIARFEAKRTPDPAVVQGKKASNELNELLDGFDVNKALKEKSQNATVLAEASAAAQKANDGRSIYRQSESRKQLAEFITDPRNPYFARAFVNRIWADLVGRGFVEPLDNFSAYNDIRHPQMLQFLAQEFIASGYDLRELIKLVMLTKTYQRGHLPAGASAAAVARAEEMFTATRSRRMLGEVLFDSIVAAGHLFSHKWPEGANVREVQRQIRIALAPPALLAAAAEDGQSEQSSMMAMKSAAGAAPYDVEKGASLDFDALLKPAMTKKDEKGDGFSDVLNESKKDIAMRTKMENDATEATRQARLRLLQSGNAERFRLETITERIDDNPKFASTFRMATPAPPSHFLRVFGQPARDNLGEFRDEAPSLRQELLMLNGKATHEASRVGPLEPIYQTLGGKNPDAAKAVEFAYLEILTRHPSQEELAEARDVISAGSTMVEGLADLRWALLNSHQFRYLP